MPAAVVPRGWFLPAVSCPPGAQPWASQDHQRSLSSPGLPSGGRLGSAGPSATPRSCRTGSSGSSRDVRGHRRQRGGGQAELGPAVPPSRFDVRVPDLVAAERCRHCGAMAGLSRSSSGPLSIGPVIERGGWLGSATCRGGVWDAGRNSSFTDTNWFKSGQQSHGSNLRHIARSSPNRVVRVQ
ncbi:unnamed protein product [Prorocentrum cordatum]|nr:unnamed protein product [Polarella glacialis]